MTSRQASQQLSLDDQASYPTEAWRPIHYLGSKLRFVKEIGSIASNVLPSRSKACDLFAGSGTVSSYLAQNYQVTSVDIQEYSRAICSALFNSTSDQSVEARSLLAKISASGRDRAIIEATRPLVNIENLAYQEAQEGHLELLCDIIENGALISLEHEVAIDQRLQDAKEVACTRLKQAELWDEQSTTVLRYFGGVYFSYQHAIEIDRFRSLAEMCAPQIRDTYIAASLSTASELVNTIGKHFAQPLRPRNKEGKIKGTLLNIVSRDRFRKSEPIFFNTLKCYAEKSGKTKGRSKAVRADYREFLASEDLDNAFVYADPPYTRDHYSRFYHVLETIALRDNPEVSTNFAHGVKSISRGLYRKERHQSPFCILSQAPSAFDEMFAKISSAGAPMVLSYSPFDNIVDNHPRVVSLDLISELASKYYRHVDVLSAGKFSHSRLNRSDLHKERSNQSEKFVVCY